MSSFHKYRYQRKTESHVILIKFVKYVTFTLHDTLRRNPIIRICIMLTTIYDLTNLNTATMS